MRTDRKIAQAFARGVPVCILGAILYGTAGAASAEGPLTLAGGQLEPAKWSELTGWTADDHLAAFAAYQTSCQALRKRRADDRRGISVALANVCRKAIGLQPRDAGTARAFFEENFQPVRIGRLGEAEGLLTGYFEPVVAGSRFPSPEFPVPLYRRPRDLVADGYKPGSIAFPNRGVRIGRRTGTNELVPYHDRGAIEAGALDGKQREICWLKDPFDLLEIQMQGSGRVILEDGTPLRVSYDSHNGYSYSSIERALVERNFMSRREMSRERIRAWMAAHPDEAAKVRAANRAYVFFRVTGLTNDGEPVGAQGVPLTPGRSIAVDRMHEYGTPFFIEANLSIERAKPATPFRRLMIAQDTGSAIVGPARADLYWGSGDEAARVAGRIRHPGRFVMLLPRELDIVAAGSRMPLPTPKPKMAALEAGKRDGTSVASSANAGAFAAARPVLPPVVKPKSSTIKVKKQDGKGHAEPAGASSGAIVARRQTPLPAPTKISVIEIRKQDAKGKVNSANVSEITAGSQQKPSLAPKSKTPGTEVKKQNRKGKAEAANAGEDGRAAARSGRQAAPTRKSDPSLF